MGYLSIILKAIGDFFSEFEKKKWKPLSWFQKILRIIIVLSIVIVAIWKIGKMREENLIAEVKEKIGRIKDEDGAIYPKIQLGKGGSTFVNKGKGNFIVDKSGEPILKVYVLKHRLFVFAVVRDFNGKSIAVIDKNEWTVFSDDYEYNNDNTGFELVTQGDRQVYFQIFYKDSMAHFMGFLVSPKGAGLYVYGAPNGGTLMATTIEIKSFNYPNESYKTLFKYPRETHLHERN